MQNRPPDSVAGSVREIRLDQSVLVLEANAAKWHCFPRTYTDTELPKRCQPIRHDAFAARFVDRRLRAVSDGDVESRLPSCNRSRQSGWTTTGNEHLGFLDGFAHRCYLGSIVARKCTGHACDLRHRRDACFLGSSCGRGESCLTAARLTAAHERPISSA